MGKQEAMLELQAPKNWQVSRDGGPRKIIREDLRLISDES
jgi:hypothetical protein